MEFINILKKQSEALKKEFEEDIQKVQYKEDLYIYHAYWFEQFKNRAFHNLTSEEAFGKLNMENMNYFMNTTINDLETIHQQVDIVSDKFANLYNANQDYKTRLKNKVNYLVSLVGDTEVMLDQYDKNSVTFRDSFTGYSYIEDSFIDGDKANISTSEGIAYLSVDSEEQRNTEAIKMTVTSPLFETNQYGVKAELGNNHVAKKTDVKVGDEYEYYIDLMSKDDPHDKPASITDDNPTTWTEIQILGMDEANKTKYKVDWAKARRTGEKLDITVNLEFESMKRLNWIDILPYIPTKSNANIKVTSIQVSETGTTWTDVYTGSDTINMVSQSNTSKDISGKKIITQGLYTFKTKICKFVKIHLLQDISYDEYFAVPVCYKVADRDYKYINDDEWLEKNAVILDPSDPLVTGNFKDGSLSVGMILPYEDTQGSKFYLIYKYAYIPGWRYIIGLRGIDLFDKRFTKDSQLITKKFSADKPISRISLSANEFIPNEFMSQGLTQRNEWIKYYISVDDKKWNRISPMHHNQIGGLGLANKETSYKIYEINSNTSVEERIKNINKGYIDTEDPVKSFRLKIVFQRPDNEIDLTPILEEYAIRCDLKEE